MAGTITHRWDGTVLTITSDSGTSSADLKGSEGAMGPRGPQGAAGVVVGGDIDLTGYATEAYVDQAIAGIEGGGGSADLSNYYTKAQTDAAIQNAIADIEPGTGGGADVDLSDYYTKSEVDNLIPDTSGLATETYVTNKIAEAQLGGGDGGSVDLTGYATKDDLSAYRKIDNNTFNTTVSVRDGSNNISIYASGIQGNDGALWIGSNGNGNFSTLLIKDKVVATEEFVTTKINEAIAALDGDGVSY